MQDVFSRFERFLRENPPEFDSIHPYFKKASYEMVLNGGKRFRPKLFLSVVEALEPLLIEPSLPVALSIETLHTYSLIHDDLPAMDDASLRRGHPTLHKKYDEVSAILAGDGLNSYSFYLISKAPLSAEVRIKLVEVLSDMGGFGGMVSGQAVDCFFESTPLSRDDIEAMHIAKTGRLIAASLKMGAITACAPKELQDRLFELGLKAGLLFQINDDIVDVTQSTKEVGKDTSSDSDKNSYVTIFGLDEAKKQREEIQKELKDKLESYPDRLRVNLMGLMQNYL